MDLETGETSTDIETGEIYFPPVFNEETGEYEGGFDFPQRFRIPNPYAEMHKSERRPYKLLKADKYELQLITATIFLFPTMFLFYPILGVFMIIFEMILHNWTHKKNKSLKNSAVYYQSPLHLIVKEFCARCQDENSKEKITKMQDMRNDKYGLEYIRRVVT